MSAKPEADDVLIPDDLGSPGERYLAVPLPAPGRRETLRSTTTVRIDPGRPVTPTVLMSLRWPPDRSNSAFTCSGGTSIRDDAISTCSCRSSVSPRAAAIASWRVGGSRRTRRGPYLVFQTSLMVAFAA